ncbi:MAG: hypothetical protein IAI50_01620 [Candidatus Eremiobacteraeota bacterium]|nr:hypothetical protein [Candidatus Eremiobacteraeota bacterium]
MPTVGQVEEQIYACEGFRVRLTPFKAGQKSFPSYDFLVMAPQRWRLSDWKTVRLKAYIPLIREIVIQKGDATPIKSDVQLGRLRDTYYEAKYGSTDPGATPPAEVTTLPTPSDAGKTSPEG